MLQEPKLWPRFKPDMSRVTAQAIVLKQEREAMNIAASMTKRNFSFKVFKNKVSCVNRSPGLLSATVVSHDPLAGCVGSEARAAIAHSGSGSEVGDGSAYKRR